MNMNSMEDNNQPEGMSERKEETTGESSSSSSSAFECNICLDTASEPVVTTCGHLYCWPCMHKWLEMHPDSQSCPVCKAAITRDKIIPLYGRSGEQQDPRKKKMSEEKVPQRPAAQRGESVRQSNPQRGPIPDNFFPPAGFPMGPAPFGHTNMWTGSFGSVNLGFGVFPPLFGLQFATGFPEMYGGHGGVAGQGQGQGYAQPLNPQEAQQQQLAKLLMWMGFFILICILFL
jgi:E3 ubiquitin-protein ligase RNF5